MGGTLRRIWGVIASAALAVLMTRAATSAAPLANSVPRYDFASALMLSVFGEITDANASFFAQNGDRISESPLRELALRVAPPARFLSAQINGVAAVTMPPVRLSLSNLNGNATALSQAVSEGLLPSTGYASAAPAGGAQQVSSPLTLTDTPTYRPLPPVPAMPPAPGTFAFDAPATGSQENTLTLSPQSDRPLTLSGSVPDPTAPAFSAPSDELPNLALNDRAALSGNLAVPQLHRVTLNVNDDLQHPYGNDAMVGVPNLGPTPNLYAGKLTYAIPSLSSTLSVSAYQERLGQNALPPNAYTNNGGDVNFTVKF
jgi:hypothetical protein